MAGPKTQRTGADVEAFLASIADPRRQEETRRVAAMMTRVTGEAAAMWGTSIIGFGTYRYTNAKGREQGWFLTGVAPRKQALTVYIMPGFSVFESQLAALGPHRLGRSCLYLRRLDAVDFAVLEDLVRGSVEIMRERYS